MQPGDRVRVERAGTRYEGVLLPSSTSTHAVLKLDGGYNVGIERASASFELVAGDVRDVEQAQAVDGTSQAAFDEELPTIALISTGGTIASTVDYRTGAVTAQFDAEDVLRAVPDLAGRANYRGRVVANMLSENMDPAVWVELAEAIHEEIADGADGVVVMHGTDTMQYTASAMAFMLETPVPIVFTGSQRSADRPSSDNVMNAVCAVETAKADAAEVLVCMHATGSDDRCAIHRATRVRKNHTSRRAAFETVGAQPIGTVEWATERVTFERAPTPRGAQELAVSPELSPAVELVKFVPGMDVQALDYVEGAAGLVLEGTGLGHVNTELLPRVRELIDGGTTVVMTSQSLDGRVCDRVYETGRDLLDAGVIEGGTTLPETMLVKLMWLLANRPAEVETMVGRSMAGEAPARTRPWR
jgi:glutamyl-tRNA(Gln) amidotransferase subunit D